MPKEFLQFGLNKLCYYCGGYADTKDHIPSKVLLDAPYPDPLETVPCCKECNIKFSKDEEYAAVLIECIKKQSTNPMDFDRPKVKKILTCSPKLLGCVERSIEYDSLGRLHISPKDTRFQNIILKLARAHLRNENGLFFNGSKFFKIEITTVEQMTEYQYIAFSSPQKINLLPEVASKALLNLNVSPDNIPYSDWHVFQENTYSYYVSGEGDEVKILIQNFLAIRVILETDE